MFEKAFEDDRGVIPIDRDLPCAWPVNGHTQFSSYAVRELSSSLILLSNYLIVKRRFRE